MFMLSDIDRINLRTMRSASAVEHYAREWLELEPRERVILDLVADEARGQPVLDIGVGGGRTVPGLRAVSSDYLGVDNSPEMIAACRQRFPDARFELADARDMKGIADQSIFLVLFSCNGIGMVSHEDRLLILREVYRVLRPGGIFILTTHNERCPDCTAGFQFPPYEVSANPARLLVRSMRFASSTIARLVNRRRNLPHEVRTPDYSIINDVCHDYGTMLYYIGLNGQRRQLEQFGFLGNAEAFDLDGRRVEGDCTDSSLALIARKPAASPG